MISDFDPPKVESFTKIDRKYTIQLCDAMLQCITDSRNKELENHITEKMKEDRRGFWDYLLKRPIVHCTREQAITELKQREEWQWTSDYNSIMGHYKTQEITCNRIKALALASADSCIFITADDLHSISL